MAVTLSGEVGIRTNGHQEFPRHYTFTPSKGELKAWAELIARAGEALGTVGNVSDTLGVLVHIASTHPAGISRLRQAKPEQAGE